MIGQKKGKPSRVYDGEYPLTGIIRCPECGAGMVISGTTNKLKDGSKKRVFYYVCGRWKNQGSSACRSNGIRVEKANAVVYNEIQKVLSNEILLRKVVDKVNEQNLKKMKLAEKGVAKYDLEIETQKKRQKKIFEAYEDGVITSEEFINRKNEIDNELKVIEANKEEALILLAQEHTKTVSYEFVRDVMINFKEVISSDKIGRELKKRLLHMIISEITIDKRREIDSIKIVLTSELVKFLESTVDGGALLANAPPFFDEYVNGDFIVLEFVI